jgi:clan AA aspartic protease
MGLAKVTVKISGFQEGKDSYEALFLVDTGATDSMAPGDELEKISVPKQSKMAYELADGTVKKYSFGIVKIEFMGEITAGRIIFGDKDIEPILGVTALESVGILVDPVNKTLKRLPAIPLKHIA